MRTMTRTLATALALFLIVGLSACTSTAKPTGQEKENTSRQTGYNHLTESQPAETMPYSPTRETKNFWIRTWREKGKLAYAYISNSEGTVTGYYIFEGPPVSQCVALIPPYQKIKADLGTDTGEVVVPAPSVDGTFSSGGDCATKYGKDAVSGSYVEFNVGMGQNYQLFDQPLPPQRLSEAQPLGFATMDSVKQ